MAYPFKGSNLEWSLAEGYGLSSSEHRADMTELDRREYKVRENRIRRMAQRQGLVLVKSRRRDPRAYDYNKYMLVNPDTNFAVYGELDRTLDDVEAYLTSDRVPTP